MSLKGSKTEANLRKAFKAEAETNRRYLYFASKAEIEGHNEIASAFRATSESETGHAHGFLEYLEECGDPATGMPFGSTAANLRSAIVGETQDFEETYPAMAKEAREEGHSDIADWFEILAKAEQTHAVRLQKMLDKLESQS